MTKEDIFHRWCRMWGNKIRGICRDCVVRVGCIADWETKKARSREDLMTKEGAKGESGREGGLVEIVPESGS